MLKLIYKSPNFIFSIVIVIYSISRYIFGYNTVINDNYTLDTINISSLLLLVLLGPIIYDFTFQMKLTVRLIILSLIVVLFSMLLTYIIYVIILGSFKLQVSYIAIILLYNIFVIEILILIKFFNVSITLFYIVCFLITSPYSLVLTSSFPSISDMFYTWLITPSGVVNLYVYLIVDIFLISSIFIVRTLKRRGK